MSDAIMAEMQSITRRAAEPWAPDDSVKAAILRAARRLGLPYRRARTFWYGDPAAVRAEEADSMRLNDLKLMRERRERLADDIQQIDARLTAREGRATNDQNNIPLAVATGSRVRNPVEERRGVAREEGLIADPRQAGIPLPADEPEQLSFLDGAR